MKNSFLSDVAKEYNKNIDHVAFEDLSDNHDFGRVYRSRDSIEEYRIYIDKSRLICPSQIFFVLYHEIGHVVLFHMGYLYCRNSSTEKEDKERQVDIWAFKEMGMMDAQGKIKHENIVCYKCICELKSIGTTQDVCPKGLKLRR